MNRTLIDLDAPYVNSRRDRDTEKWWQQRQVRGYQAIENQNSRAKAW
jgi:hypothetical protein